MFGDAGPIVRAFGRHLQQDESPVTQQLLHDVIEVAAFMGLSVSEILRDFNPIDLVDWLVLAQAF